MNFILHYGYGVFSLPRDAVLQKLPQLDAADCKVLMLLAATPALRENTETHYAEIAAQCAITELAAEDAVRRWAEAGVLTPAVYAAQEPQEPAFAVQHAEKPAEKPKKSRIPAYSDAEVAKLFSAHADLRPMIDMAQNVLGKVFSQHETASLVALYDYYGLDCHYIISLLHYLAKKNKANMRYIEATAAGLVADGVVTVGALETRFAALDRTDESEQWIRRMFGMGERALSPKEKKYLKDWGALGIPRELLEYAYEETVDHTQKPTLGYMNRILTKLHAEGITDRAGAQARSDSFHAKQENKTEKHSFAANDFLAAALARTYEDTPNSDDKNTKTDQ